MNFTVTILGSGSAVPTATRNPSSQYIECSGRTILIDCGEGTQMQFRKFGLKYQKVDFILISHLHGDHYFGLVGLLSTMHMMGRTRPIEIYGPKGLKEIIEIQLHAAGSRLAFDVNIHEIEPESNGTLIEDDKIQVSYFPIAHKIPTSGFLVVQKEKQRKLLIDKARADNVKIEYYHRLKRSEDVTDEDGRIIRFEEYTLPGEPEKRYAYCSDTKYHEPIVEFIRGVNVLYHEATFVDAHEDRAAKTKHSTAKQAAAIAKRAEVGKLFMGHLSARYENTEQHEMEARSIFERSIFVKDGSKYTL
ncbi:MAG: ribonuclease Z [Flavobacteriales bacterium]|nr:ribonuclease Z [Flavobacteriales bacterium]